MCRGSAIGVPAECNGEFSQEVGWRHNVEEVIEPQIDVHFDPASWLGSWQAEVSLREVAADGSQTCMVLAMAAIGLQTRRETLARVGPGVIGSALIGAAVVAIFVGLVVAH